MTPGCCEVAKTTVRESVEQLSARMREHSGNEDLQRYVVPGKAYKSASVARVPTVVPRSPPTAS
jgi:hypothetical protein